MRLLFIFLMCLLPHLATANDKGEIAKVSVRLFHEICIGSLANPEKALDLLDNFSKLSGDQAEPFQKSLQASSQSHVWVMNFPKANFVVVLDPAQQKCDVAGDKEVDFDDVRSEFQAASDGFKAIDGMDATPIEVDDSEAMRSMRYTYMVPAKGLKMNVFSSVNKDLDQEGQMGFIYTLFTD